MHPFERYMLRRCLVRLAFPSPRAWDRWWSNSELSVWLASHRRILGLGRLLTAEQFDDAPNAPALSRSIYGHFSNLGGEKGPRPSPLDVRLRWLGNEARLCSLDQAIMALLARMSLCTVFGGLGLALAGRLPQEQMFAGADDIPLHSIAALLGLSPVSIGARLSPDQPLIKLGLVRDRCAGDFAAGRPTMRIARAAHGSPERLRKLLVGASKPSPLAWADFAHLGLDAEHVSAVLDAAVRAKSPGINVLLHGAPGTGKTAFASAVAKRLGLQAMFVGENADSDTEPDRTQRIGELTLAQRLSGQVAGLLLVMDEAEDIFVGVDDEMGASRRGAKVFMNNLVERNAAPVIWISNHPELLGPAVLRRMTYAVAFPQLDRKARERVVRRSAARNKMQIGEDGIRTLAALDAPPALIDSGLRVAKLCNAGTEFAARAAKSVLDVMLGRSELPEQRQAEFHTAFARADANLEQLTERIVASGRTDISLCLSGMPGTGKSAYARFLAKRMGLDVMEKRASDLLGMFVGETEQKIAACFQEAERRCAFLIFDEADSLLRNRASAHRSHEVQQVNEMLTWMERHPYPFACTTNFAEGLDPAAARRFLFKVTFLPLAPPQARALFRHSFGIDAPGRLNALDLLTPGDFAVVARKASIFGERCPERLFDALAAEIVSKGGSRRRSIGFVLHAPEDRGEED